jgi:hypothetical protein
MAIEEGETSAGERCLSIGRNHEEDGGGAYFTSEDRLLRMTIPLVYRNFLRIDPSVATDMIEVLQYYLRHQALGKGEVFQVGDWVRGINGVKGEVGVIKKLDEERAVILCPGPPEQEWFSSQPIGVSWIRCDPPSTHNSAPTAWDRIQEDD